MSPSVISLYLANLGFNDLESGGWWFASVWANLWPIPFKYFFCPIPFFSKSLITYVLDLFTVSHISFTLFSVVGFSSHSFVCASVEHFLLTCLSVTKFCSFIPNQPLNPFNGLLTSDSRLFNSKIFILFFLNRFLSSTIFFCFPECSNHSYFKALICYFQCLGYL